VRTSRGGDVRGSGDDHLGTDTGERMEGMATAKASANRYRAEGVEGTELGAQQAVDAATARRLIDEWPAAPKRAAEKLLEHYGPPNEATATKLFWYGKGPWRRTVLTADEVVHNFPTPHTDFLTQYVGYRIPAAKTAELVEFDGSVLVDRTAGELGARCDDEAYNTLTLNLAHEIVTGKRTLRRPGSSTPRPLPHTSWGVRRPMPNGFCSTVPGRVPAIPTRP
jgi:hypothetical protein